MAVYQYAPYENRFAGSISDILARRGDIAAAAAQRAGVILSSGTRAIGDIQAHGQEQAGQAMASAVGGATHAVGQIPAQAAAQTAATQESTLRQGAIDDRARQAADLKALDQAYQASGGNRDAIINALPGHLRGKVAADFETFDKAHAEAAELQQKADAAKTSAFASAGMAIRGHGYDPTAAQITISDMKRKYAQDKPALAQLQQFEEALQANPSPETVKAMIDPILQADPKTREDLQKEAADAETKREHDLADTARKATLTEQQKRDEQTTKDEDARRILEGRRVVAEEANARTAGSREKREQAVYDQTYGQGGTNPDGTPKTVPISATAKAISEYKIAPLSPRSMASGAGKALMEQVMAANPSYDATQFPTRQKMRIGYTSGNQSQQLGSLNTAIEHLGVLDEMAKGLENGSFKPGNQLYNTVATLFGSSAPTNFAFARDIMSGELATAMKKSGATDSEIEKVTKSLDGAGSPKQLSDAIRVVALPMIGGKASTMQQQYRAVMGEQDPFSVYTPGAKAVLDRFGASHETAAPGGGGKGGGPGVVAAPGPKEGETRPITEPGYPAGAEMTFRGGKWIRTK
jgi:hypothetical protein